MPLDGGPNPVHGGRRPWPLAGETEGRGPPGLWSCPAWSRSSASTRDLHDPDGHEMRFYVTDEGAPTAGRPARMHDAGPCVWFEQVDRLDLAPNA